MINSEDLNYYKQKRKRQIEISKQRPHKNAYDDYLERKRKKIELGESLLLDENGNIVGINGNEEKNHLI
jgi:uncharacterized protein YuzE